MRYYRPAYRRRVARDRGCGHRRLLL